MHDIKNIIKNLNVSDLPPETRRELKKYLIKKYDAANDKYLPQTANDSEKI